MSKHKISRENMNKVVLMLVIIVPFNVYFFSSLFTHKSEMFYWPRIIDGGFDLPSITVFLPLWVGVNTFYIYVLRSMLNNKKATNKVGLWVRFKRFLVEFFGPIGGPPI